MWITETLMIFCQVRDTIRLCKICKLRIVSIAAEGAADSPRARHSRAAQHCDVHPAECAAGRLQGKRRPDTRTDAGAQVRNIFMICDLKVHGLLHVHS